MIKAPPNMRAQDVGSRVPDHHANHQRWTNARPGHNQKARSYA
jgi:hypothetical protein